MDNQAHESLTAINDARMLDLTMRKREDIINTLTAKGIPEDRADKALLISALDGVDRTILSRARIKADTKIADSQAQATSLVANILSNISGKNLKSLDNNRDIPILTIDVSSQSFAEGEMDTGTQNNDFDTFMKKFPDQNLD